MWGGGGGGGRGEKVWVRRRRGRHRRRRFSVRSPPHPRNLLHAAHASNCCALHGDLASGRQDFVAMLKKHTIEVHGDNEVRKGPRAAGRGHGREGEARLDLGNARAGVDEGTP